jgi:acetyltransferase
MGPLASLLAPRGIAIVGASDDIARPGAQTIRALDEYGYRGGIHPVNPKYPSLGGHPCYPSLAAVPKPCDVAVVAVPAEAAIDVVAQCGAAGIPFAVVLGGGFRESGTEGAQRQDRLVAAARTAGVRLLGPNCLGLVNIHDHAFAAFGSITKPPVLSPGPVSAVVQSGGFGNSIVMRLADEGVGFRCVIASGNEADLTMPELVDALVDDPGTGIIVAYIEGVADGRALMRAGARATAAGKPFIAWKAGNSKQGSKAAASHTANMTGSWDVWRAAFRQSGIHFVEDMEEITDCVRAFLAGRLPNGRGVAVMGGSGGSGVVFADCADACELDLPPFSEATARTLDALLPNMASLSNPVDYAAGFITSKTIDRYRQAVAAVLADPGIHALCITYATLIDRLFLLGSQALVDVTAKSDKPVLVFSAAPVDTAPEAFALLAKAGIPVFRSPVRMARALAFLARFAERRAMPPVPFDPMAGDRPPGVALPAAGTLDEHEGKQLLRAFGVATTDDRLVPPDDDTALRAAAPAFPVALKIVSRDIAHKTDIGAVRLGLGSPEALVAAGREIVASVRRAAPDATIRGLLVSPMITDGVEAIVGVVNDPVFGPTVALGIGGVLTEVMRDVTFRVAPFDIATARVMIGELRGAKLFAGVRGRPAADVDALARTLSRISQIAWQLRDRLDELDVNPLFVRPAGLGIAAADALVVLR